MLPEARSQPLIVRRSWELIVGTEQIFPQLFVTSAVVSVVNTLIPRLTAVCIVTLISTLNLAADTANQILANPDKYKGKEVSLDVALLRPIRWASPVDDFAIFHAMTYDKREKAPGGEILIVVPESSREELVRRYGVAVDGNRRNVSTRSLRGNLQTTRGGAGGLFYLDLTDGAAAEIITEQAVKIRPRAHSARPGGPGMN